jgi:hypothetical protein
VAATPERQARHGSYRPSRGLVSRHRAQMGRPQHGVRNGGLSARGSGEEAQARQSCVGIGVRVAAADDEEETEETQVTMADRGRWLRSVGSFGGHHRAGVMVIEPG